MRRSILQLTIAGGIAATLGAQAPVTIPFADLVKIVEATICANQKGWNQPCQPQQVALTPAPDRTGMTVTCPGCLTEMSTSGVLATGTLKAVREDNAAPTVFRSEAPDAGSLAALAARLSAHFDNRFFVEARRPRGLALEKDALLVADFGTGQGDGRIWRVSLAGHDAAAVASISGTAVAESLPSVAVATDFQGQPFKAVVGVAAVRPFEDGFLGLTNRVVGKGTKIPGLENFPAASLLRVKRSQSAVAASLIDFETRVDPDRDGIESNPHDLAVRDGLVYATDAAGNSVLRIDPRTGRISLYAVLDEIPRTQPAQDGKTTMDAVPTGLDFGPDGALYVASLGGFPFTPGSGRVVRLHDANADGDALDRDEQTVVVTGLTMAIDVTFDGNGRMFTAEHSLAFASQGPGRICRIDAGRCAQVITDKAIGPTSVVVSGGYVYYSQEFLGRVSRVRVDSGAPDDHRF